MARRPATPSRRRSSVERHPADRCPGDVAELFAEDILVRPCGGRRTIVATRAGFWRMTSRRSIVRSGLMCRGGNVNRSEEDEKLAKDGHDPPTMRFVEAVVALSFSDTNEDSRLRCWSGRDQCRAGRCRQPRAGLAAHAAKQSDGSAWSPMRWVRGRRPCDGNKADTRLSNAPARVAPSRTLT